MFFFFFFWYGFSKIQKILEIYGSFQKTHDPWAIPKILDFEAAHGFERQVVQALLEAQADLDAQWLAATWRIKMGIHAVMLIIAEGKTC